MNVYIIVGILFYALGTAMIGYGFYIIVGILLYAFGTAMIVYGQYVKNKVDSAKVSQVLQDKVDDVLKRIDEVREGEKDEASDRNISQIEQEFKNWAADFLKNRERRKVELARTELNSVDVQLRVSDKWRPIFEYVIKTIESLAHAYNIESGKIIKVNFPPLPPNLYSEAATNYDGEVVFPNKVLWSVVFLSIKPPRKNHPPSMYISFTREGDRGYLRSYIEIADFDKNTFRITLNGQNVPTTEGIEGIYPFDSYRESLKTIMQRLFEAQLLRD